MNLNQFRRTIELIRLRGYLDDNLTFELRNGRQYRGQWMPISQNLTSPTHDFTSHIMIATPTAHVFLDVEEIVLIGYQHTRPFDAAMRSGK